MTTTFHIKKDDTAPPLQAFLTDALGQLPDLTGATVLFKMRRYSDQAIVVDASADVVDIPTARVSYAWQAADTAEAGAFEAEFEVTLATGKIETFPNDGYIAVRILEDL